MQVNSKINIENKWLVWVLFAVLFLYLILRAIIVEPLLDELGTLHWYIQTGNILNEEAVLDANNHLLNSLFSHYSFRLFGDHLIAYRLLAIISFPIYFFSAKKLVSENIKQFGLIIFLALITIHWVFDYFSLSRGYAPSLAFFMLGFSFISHWNRDNKPKYLTIILISFTLCLLANLSMFIPVFLLFAYLHLTLIIQWKERLLNSKIISYILSIGFLLIAYKLFKYVSKLKEAGALWWGSKKGLWEVTGKSVSENVFFTDADFIKFGLLILVVLLSVLLIISAIKKGGKVFILSLQFQTLTLFILSLVGYVLMVSVMDVNYPQDRVAMYLVILLIIAFGSILTEHRILKWSVVVLLWFPISFVLKMNLNTTIFSPKDRIHNSFYNEVQKIVGPNDNLTADYSAHLFYSYASRNSAIAKMAVLNASETLIGEDFHLSSVYGNINDWSNYTCVLSDSITGMALYQRNSKVSKKTIDEFTIKPIQSNGMYLPLLDYSFRESEEFTHVQIRVDGSIALTKGLLTLDLIEDIVNDEQKPSNYNSTLFHWYFGKDKNYSFNYSRLIKLSDFQSDMLKIYIYNPEMAEVAITDIKIKIIGISNTPLNQ